MFSQQDKALIHCSLIFGNELSGYYPSSLRDKKKDYLGEGILQVEDILTEVLILNLVGNIFQPLEI